MNLKRSMLLIIGFFLVIGMFSSVSHAWWNSTYTYRKLINTSNMNNGQQVYVEFCGGNQSLMTKKSNDIYLYYNTQCGDSADYVMANDTDQLPIDVIQGDGDSYNEEQVYDNMVLGYHSEKKDTWHDVKNQYNLTLTSGTGGTMVVNGNVNNATYVDCESDDCYYYDSTSVSFSGSNAFCFWLNSTSFGNSNDGWTHYMDIAEGEYRLMSHTDGNIWLYMGDWAETTMSDLGITTNENNRICINYNETASTTEWYVNGQYKFTNSTSTTFSANGDIVVGADNSAETYRQIDNDIVDEMYIYDDAKSSDFFNDEYNTQIQSLGYGNLGTQETQDTNSAPSISISSPNTGKTYYKNNIDFNFTVTDDNSSTFIVKGYEDGNLIYDNSGYVNGTEVSESLFDVDGSHNVTVYANDTQGKTSSKTINYEVWMGYNISVYDNSTGNNMTNWTISFSNSTNTTKYENQTNPTLYPYEDLPYGDINITVSDAKKTLYYYNTTVNSINNETNYHELDINLIEKQKNPINLDSDPGWTVTKGDTVTVTCSAPEGTVDFLREGVSLTSPNTAEYDSGTFTFTCKVDEETENYAPNTKTNDLLVNPLFGCVSRDVYVFNKSIPITSNLTGLNFTELINKNKVKNDFSDVNIKENVTEVKRKDEYLIINTTNISISSFTVQFQNYYANNSYPTASSLPSTIVNITNYKQENYQYRFDLQDELTGKDLNPPNSTLLMGFHCDEGETFIPLDENTTEFYFPGEDYFNWVYLKVKYSATDFYSRNWYPEENKDSYYHIFYIVDAYERALDKIQFVMDDPNHYGSKLIIYKVFGDNSFKITEGFFDVSHTFTAYLVEDEQYRLKVQDSGGSTELGKMLIVEPATKHLTPPKMGLDPKQYLISNNIEFEAYFQNDTADITDLIIKYNDKSEKTINVSISVETNETIYENMFYQNSFTTIVPDVNTTNSYYISYLVEHEDFGNSPVPYGHMVSSFKKGIDFGWGSMMNGLFAFVILFFIATMITPKNLVAGGFIFLSVTAIVMMMGWINLSIPAITILVVFIIVGIVLKVKRGGGIE